MGGAESLRRGRAAEQPPASGNARSRGMVERPEPGSVSGPGWLAALRTCGGGPGRLVSRGSASLPGIARGWSDANRWCVKTQRSLKTYRAKRDFQKTPSPLPRCRSSRRGEEPLFVVHKHDATRMHYDLRLEIDGALASWAIPKGPSYDPKQKRLAVETEDHPMSYAALRGPHPGRGVRRRGLAALGRGHLRHGAARQGPRAAREGPPGGGAPRREAGGPLAPHPHARDGRKNQWLCFKSTRWPREAGLRHHRRAPRVREDRPPRDARPRAQERARAGATLRRRRCSQRVWPPMLAKLSTPDEAQRRHPRLRGEVRRVPRHRRALRQRARPQEPQRQRLVRALPRRSRMRSARLRVPEAVMDGEIVALDKKGRSSFQLLQNQSGGELRFVAFDLLWLDGHDLRDKPLEAAARAAGEPVLGREASAAAGRAAGPADGARAQGGAAARLGGPDRQAEGLALRGRALGAAG